MLINITPFWQWDLNRHIELCEPENVMVYEVDFARSDGTPDILTVEPDRSFSPPVVHVPNIFLQSYGGLKVYERSCDADGNRTIHEYTIHVRPRKKPPDYIYAETEIKTWEDLKARVTTLEEAGGTREHPMLAHRDAAEQHPIGSITGLRGELDSKLSGNNELTNMEIQELLGW